MNFWIRIKPFLIIWALFNICFVTGCRKSVENAVFKEPKWNLVFQDDFNDSTLNQSAWSHTQAQGRKAMD